MSRAARNVVLIFSQHVLGAFTGIVGAFFVFRHMPEPEVQWGIVAFALALGGMFAFVMRAFDEAHVKRLSEGMDEPTCNGTYLLLKTFGTLVYVAAIYGGTLLWTDVLPALTGGTYGGGFETQVHQRVLNIVIIYYLLNGLGEVTRRTYEGEGNMLVGQAVLASEHVVKTAAIVFVSLGGLGAVELAWSYTVGAAVLAVVALAYLVRRPVGRPDRRTIASYWDFAGNTLMAAALGAVSAKIGPVLVQLFWNASEVTYLTAPLRFVAFITAAGTAVGTVLLPQISSRHSRGDASGDLVGRAMLLTAAMVGPVTAVLVALPEGVIHVLLSDRALPAAPVMRLLGIAAFLGAIRAPMNTKILGIDRPDVTRTLMAAMVAVGIVLYVLFVPTSLFGIPLLGAAAYGAALARLTGGVVSLVVAIYVVKRLTGFVPPVDLWRPAVAMVATALVLDGLTTWFPELQFRIWHLLAAGAVAMVTFWAALWAVRGVTDDDRILIRVLLHPRQWADFLATEARTGRR